MDILALRWFGNALEDYLYAGAVFIVVYAALKLFQVVVLARLRKLSERTHTKLDDEVIDIVRTVKPRVYTLVALFVAVRTLVFAEIPERLVDVAFLVLLTWEAVQVVQRLVDFGIRSALAKSPQEEDSNAVVIRNLNFIVKLGIWSVGFLFVLSQLGVDITSLVAGLGIGGIAVALALQNVLGDLFSSFSIYFDKPFRPGDVILVGGQTGTVKTIGLKTTRIQTLRGEELVVSNRELTSAQINNFGRMDERRVDVTLGLVYGIDPGKLRRVPEMLETAIGGIEHARFDRAHFRDFAASSLDFELVYFVDSPDYNRYMDVRQAVNFAILDAFQKEGIEFAFPTQTVMLERN